jgi:oligopeptide/dipeptide ABC transporter ATP-binding protein
MSDSASSVRVEPLLSVRDLTVRFAARRGYLQAVNGLSFSLSPGEALGIVGESGSGKSVSALALLGLLGRTARITAGSAVFEGRDLIRLGASARRAVRGARIGMVFQDPMSSLNPVLNVRAQIEEPLRTHLKLSPAERRKRVRELLERVGIPDPHRIAASYPHQLSGGMRQRVMIAMAVACEPALLIADEPTTALDVTIQAQILELFRDLRRRTRMALLLITHDLGIVAGITDRVVVMYAGRAVEYGPTEAVLAQPLHPYTRGLLLSIPRLDRTRGERLTPIQGSPPDPSRAGHGCPFAPRCPLVAPICTIGPSLISHERGGAVACWAAATPTGAAS